MVLFSDPAPPALDLPLQWPRLDPVTQGMSRFVKFKSNEYEYWVFARLEPGDFELQWERQAENIPEQQRGDHASPQCDEALDHKTRPGQPPEKIPGF